MYYKSYFCETLFCNCSYLDIPRQHTGVLHQPTSISKTTCPEEQKPVFKICTQNGTHYSKSWYVYKKRERQRERLIPTFLA